MEDNELEFLLPNRKNIVCKNCIYGQHNYMSSFCVKYKLKPKEVYYKGDNCEFFKEIPNKDAN